MAEHLFDREEFVRPDASEAEPDAPLGGQPRLRMPQRDQIEMHWASLDELLEPDHPARMVWEAVKHLDLSAWTQDLRAVEGRAGRNATDPRILVAVWVYATLDGVGSARRLAQLCEQHVAYRWLCGGVTLNHHLLSDFRSEGGDKWDALLTQIVAALMAEDLVTMNRVAQDGMRVRASAGKSSYRRRSRLEQALEEAQQQVEALKAQLDEPASEVNRRRKAARERAARDRTARLEDALRQCGDLQQQREKRAKTTNQPAKEARTSTTDPDARVMQFSDGGFRPGYNVQFATDVASGVIVGVEVTSAGSDGEQLPPMLDQLYSRYERSPEEALVDGGFASREAISEAGEKHGCTVYAPLKDEKKQRAAGTDPHAPKKGDNAIVAAWRQRMGTAAGKAIYVLRCQTAEWVNALARNCGLRQLPVCGQKRCRNVALLYAIAHNLRRQVALRVQAAAAAR